LYLEELEEYVERLFLDHQESYLIYHNLDHTRKVVHRCREMAGWYLLKKREEIILYTAAWFHDTGHLFVDMAVHETKSVAIMKDFLMTKNMAVQDIIAIEKCILSTQIPQRPTTLLENILCDADLYHLGTDEFRITDTQVREETELRSKTKIKNWTENSIKFLESHHYFTDYCQRLLKSGKEDNIRYLKGLLSK
jgi:HD superfamily phosphodiesterase